MKAIIERELYDTENAREIVSWNNGCMPNDFNYICETLYMKKNGTYFIHRDDDCRAGLAEYYGYKQRDVKKRIWKVTRDGALDWLIRCEKIDEALEDFSDLIKE